MQNLQRGSGGGADLLGNRLVTVQTGPEGKLCERVYIEVAEPFIKELYLGFVLDEKLSASV